MLDEVKIYVDKEHRIYAAVQDEDGVCYVVSRSPVTRENVKVKEIAKFKDWKKVQFELDEYAKKNQLDSIPF